MRFGTASRDIQQSDWSGSVGLRYRGLIEGRGDDIAGIAMTTSHASAKYRLLNASAPSESVVEMTYRMQLQPWVAIQPMLQHIIHPNMDNALGNAWVAGARLELAL